VAAASRIPLSVKPPSSPAALPRWGETGSPVSVLMVKCRIAWIT
jgi:hypothetical protein